MVSKGNTRADESKGCQIVSAERYFKPKERCCAWISTRARFHAGMSQHSPCVAFNSLADNVEGRNDDLARSYQRAGRRVQHVEREVVKGIEGGMRRECGGERGDKIARQGWRAWRSRGASEGRRLKMNMIDRSRRPCSGMIAAVAFFAIWAGWCAPGGFAFEVLCGGLVCPQTWNYDATYPNLNTNGASAPRLMEPTPGGKDRDEFSYTLAIGEAISLTFRASSKGDGTSKNVLLSTGKWDPNIWMQVPPIIYMHTYAHLSMSACIIHRDKRCSQGASCDADTIQDEGTLYLPPFFLSNAAPGALL